MLCFNLLLPAHDNIGFPIELYVQFVGKPDAVVLEPDL